jgi:hypothetical protein
MVLILTKTLAGIYTNDSGKIKIGRLMLSLLSGLLMAYHLPSIRITPVADGVDVIYTASGFLNNPFGTDSGFINGEEEFNCRFSVFDINLCNILVSVRAFCCST